MKLTEFEKEINLNFEENKTLFLSKLLETNDKELIEEFLDKYLPDKFAGFLFQYYSVDEHIIEKYIKNKKLLPETLNSIFFYQKFSEDFLKRNKRYITHWKYVLEVNEVSEEFLEEMIPYWEKLHSDIKLNVWEAISSYQDISKEFIEKYKNKIFWSLIGRQKDIPEDFLFENRTRKINWNRIFEFHKNYSLNFFEKILEDDKLDKDKKAEIFDNAILNGYKFSEDFIEKIFIEKAIPISTFNVCRLIHPSLEFVKSKLKVSDDILIEFYSNELEEKELLEIFKNKSFNQKKFLLYYDSDKMSDKIFSLLLNNFQKYYYYYKSDEIRAKETLVKNINSLNKIEILLKEPKQNKSIINFINSDKEIKNQIRKIITEKKNWINFFKDKKKEYLEKKYPNKISTKMAIIDIANLFNKIENNLKGMKIAIRKIKKNIKFNIER